MSTPLFNRFQLAAWSTLLVGAVMGCLLTPPACAQGRLPRGGVRAPFSTLLSDEDSPTRSGRDTRSFGGTSSLRVIREDAFDSAPPRPAVRWDAPSLDRFDTSSDSFGLGPVDLRDGHGPQRSRGPAGNRGRSPATPLDSYDQRPVGSPGLSLDAGPLPAPVTPAWRGHLAPAQELISRRYSDPRVRAFASTTTPQQVLTMYGETLNLIAARHLDPPAPARLVQRGLFNLVEALRNPTFQQGAQLSIDPQQLPAFEQQLVQLFQQYPPQTPSDATQLLQTVMQAAQQSLGLNPVLVGLEFEYGAIESLDQFSAFVPPTPQSGSAGDFSAPTVGIGVQVQVAPEGLRVLRTLAGSPAQQAGLQPEDVILSVDGQPLAGRDLTSATALIAGPEGTQVTLAVVRSNAPPTAVAIPRQRLELRSITDARLLTPQTGYLRLDTFSSTSTQEMQQALQSLANQGMQNLVLDLRGNPGGLLTTAIEIGRLFVKDGTVVSTRGRTQDDTTSEPGADGATWNLPLAVLVDGDSASASEILAAAIQENNRGVIVGTQTYGKGTVQTLFPLQTAGVSLRLTTAQFYSPRGREMAGNGVTPDIPVTGNDATLGTPADAPLQQAISAVNQARPGAMTTPLVRGRTNRNRSLSSPSQTGRRE